MSLNDSIIFIRHNFSNAEKLWTYCKENHYVAIHFNREKGVKIEDYSEEARRSKGFREAFAIFKDLATYGGLVVAQYETSQFYIGEVRPGTEIEFYDFGTVIENSESNFYKLLKLTKRVGPYNYSTYPLLSALRPPYTTIRPFSEYAHNLILHIWSGEKLECDINNLHPKMLEQMCDEWLRSEFAGEYAIKFELLKTGKTLPVIDIYAETKSGKRLFVQVTHTTDSSKALSKAKNLKEYIDNNANKDTGIIALFFGREKHNERVRNLGLNFVSIESVFNQFNQIPYYKNMLEKMIGIK